MVAYIGQNHRSFQSFQRITCYLINSVMGVSLPHQGRDSSHSASLYPKNNREIPPPDAKKEYKNMRLQSSRFHE